MKAVTDSSVARAFIQLGNEHSRKRSYVTAAEVYREAALVYGAAGMHAESAVVSIAVARCWENARDYRSASLSYEAAMADAHACGNAVLAYLAAMGAGDARVAAAQSAEAVLAYRSAAVSVGCYEKLLILRIAALRTAGQLALQAGVDRDGGQMLMAAMLLQPRVRDVHYAAVEEALREMEQLRQEVGVL